jgi:hypothetical protein
MPPMKTMLRFYLYFAAIPLFILSAVLLLIHLQPYDDHELRQLLLPDNCPASCFMGIRPDVTPMNEAINILLASKWVTMQPTDLTTSSDLFEIYFNWTGSQSPLVDKTEPLILTIQNTVPQKVTQITFWLQHETRLGELYLSLGIPSRFQVSMSPPNSAPSPYLNILQQYDDGRLTIEWASICPIKLTRILHQQFGAKIEYNWTFRSDISRTDFKGMLQYPPCG